MAKLKNYMEIVVEQMFDTTTQGIDICRCDRCKLDIMAIALNSLKPRYVVSDEGYVYVKANAFVQQFSTDVILAITKGAMVVSEHKNHD